MLPRVAPSSPALNPDLFDMDYGFGNSPAINPEDSQFNDLDFYLQPQNINFNNFNNLNFGVNDQFNLNSLNIQNRMNSISNQLSSQSNNGIHNSHSNPNSHQNININSNYQGLPNRSSSGFSTSISTPNMNSNILTNNLGTPLIDQNQNLMSNNTKNYSNMLINDNTSNLMHTPINNPISQFQTPSSSNQFSSQFNNLQNNSNNNSLSNIHQQAFQNKNYHLMPEIQSFDLLNNDSLLSNTSHISSFIPSASAAAAAAVASTNSQIPNEDFSMVFPSVSACTPPPPHQADEFISPTRRGSVRSDDAFSNQYKFQPKQQQQLAHQQNFPFIPYRRYKVIRGISSGGCATRPPRQASGINARYIPVNLNLIDASVEELCYPEWNEYEQYDRRRIIRIERRQMGSKIVANFSIVGSANENPVPKPTSSPGTDVVEVSCLECFVKQNEDDDETSDGETLASISRRRSTVKLENVDDIHTNNNGQVGTRQYYITSVEVIKIVELLIGTEVKDPADRRRERGRIRSNLVPFWSRKPISSRMTSSSTSNNSNGLLESPNNSFNNGNISNTENYNGYSEDFRVELAKRIMGYDVRKPRGFDKEVRILKWEKLVPALRRALQSYYVELPNDVEQF